MSEPIDIRSIRPQPVEVDPRVPMPAPRRIEPVQSFKQVLTESLGEVQRLQVEADTQIRRLVAGEIKDVTEAMVAVEKADLSFKTMMAVRNKIVAAYEEVMRMQV
jgi:flagellar hook-basal body complex protein FliE